MINFEDIKGFKEWVGKNYYWTRTSLFSNDLKLMLLQNYFREELDLYICIDIMNSDVEWYWTIYDCVDGSVKKPFHEDDEYIKTYEQALEAGLIEANKFLKK